MQKERLREALAVVSGRRDPRTVNYDLLGYRQSFMEEHGAPEWYWVVERSEDIILDLLVAASRILEEE